MNRLQILILAVLVFIACSPKSDNQQQEDSKGPGPIKVEVVEENGSFQLYRAGQPYIVKGAGLEFGDKEGLRSHGANSFRTWRTENGRESALEVLDKAQALGFTVSMCLEVVRERHGFDYDDPEAVERQFQELKAEVLKYKDHPALLTWIVGNELNLLMENPKIYDAVNDISKMVHELDPYHPTTTTTAGFNKDLGDIIAARAPDLDFLSIQMYGDLINLPRYVDEAGYEGPYMITEWGAVGHWEVPATDWGAPVENHSSAKAANYLRSYKEVIEPYKDQIIGNYVFLWGQKQERTPTWYGMFLPTGEETETVDIVHYIWNGEWPENRTPQVQAITLNEQEGIASVKVSANEDCSAIAQITDPDGDELTYRWEIMEESEDLGDGGDQEEVPERLEGLIQDPTLENIAFTAPGEAGAYRLFVYAFDGNNHAAHANIPFLVE